MAVIESCNFQPLCKFDSSEATEILDVLDKNLLDVYDNTAELRQKMVGIFRQSLARQDHDIGSKKWLKLLEDFFKAFTCRRIQRVQERIHVNTEGYTDNEKVQQLLRKADTDYFRQLLQVWSVCG